LRAAAAIGLAIACAMGVACRDRGDDPVLAHLQRSLKRGERILALRDLESVAGGSFAVVVVAPGGKPEFRILQQDGDDFATVFSTRQGDLFRSFALEDVNADGRDEILVTWRGGHLEMIEVLGRDPQGAWTSLFQEAGREIERRHGVGGTSEFWITSRTYEEGPDQPPAHATTVYRWANGTFVESK
jgi:hypothetical protein